MPSLSSNPVSVDQRQVSDLALFGGAPQFAEKLHVGRPNTGERTQLLARLNDLLDRRWLTNNGPYVQELEQRIAAMLGVKHCVAVCNGTVGLEIAIRALDLRGEVIVPAMTFIATAHALQWLGITPVFADLDPATHNLDPRAVEARITPRTSGILGVHVWGRPCAPDALAALARARGLKLLFDAAHAFGCSHHATMLGNFGDAEVFSFHATKFFNTFEGGAITTNDDALAAKLRLMRNFGFAGFDHVVSLGINGKLNEVSAVMGLSLLDELDTIVAANARNYQIYREQLGGLPGVRVLEYDTHDKSNYQYIVLEIDAAARLRRDTLMRLLWAENIVARRYFYPGCHRMEPYRTLQPDARKFLPQTEALVERVLCLPSGAALGVEEVRAVCELIQFALAHGDEIETRLQSDGQA